MAIMATNENTGGSFVLVPAGTHIARCYSMIHIGTGVEMYMGKEKIQNKVRITFELPTELMEFKDGEGKKPMTISKDFTLSMYEKANLRKVLEGWRGKGFTEDEAKAFNVAVLIGKPCMVTVVHQAKKDGSGSYATINSISGLPKGFDCPPQINPSFEWSYENFDEARFNTIPDYIKDKMKLTNEYKAAVAPHNQEAQSDTSHETNIDDDDLGLPF